MEGQDTLSKDFYAYYFILFYLITFLKVYRTYVFLFPLRADWMFNNLQIDTTMGLVQSRILLWTLVLLGICKTFQASNDTGHILAPHSFYFGWILLLKKFLHCLPGDSLLKYLAFKCTLL